mgnify:CR=1 FL=1
MIYVDKKLGIYTFLVKKRLITTTNEDFKGKQLKIKSTFKNEIS